MRIEQLDPIPDEAVALSQFLALDDPSQTFKITILQLIDAMVERRLNDLFVSKADPRSGSTQVDSADALTRKDYVDGATKAWGLGTYGSDDPHQWSGFIANPDSGNPEWPLNGAGFQSVYAPTRRAQLWVHTDGTVLFRFSLSETASDTATPWAVHYTSANPPTAADVGAASLDEVERLRAELAELRAMLTV